MTKSGRDWWHVIAQPSIEKLLTSFNLQFTGLAEFETQTLEYEPSLFILSPYSDKRETHKWPRARLKALGGGIGTKKESFFLLGLPTSFLASLDTRALSFPKGDVTRDDSQLFAVYANFGEP